MSMLESLKNETNYKLTENGGVTHKTSKSYVLDYFAQGSSLRNRYLNSIVELFEKSYNENPLLTMKVLFNSRDIRHGQGERSVFNKLIKYLAINKTEVIEKNIELIPVFGRWDDIYALFDTPLQSKAIELIKKQLEKDLISDNPSICAKWLKSENASSLETKRLAKITREGLGYTPKKYRKILSTLRKKIDIVETKITEGRFSDIEYDKLPSCAGLKYRNVFFTKDEERYCTFINSLSKGERTINVGTLYPYDLVRKVRELNDYIVDSKQKDLLNNMWNNLPDFIGEDYSDTLAVIDVSGSMYGTPIEVAISLGLYLAERNKGEFRNHFITFSSNPKLVEIIGDNFVDKVKFIERANWGWSTNIEATFDLILNTAIKNNLPQEDIPERIIIISDMEFDSADDGCFGSKTNFDIIKEKFAKVGYEMPRLVFWNVNSRQNNIPITMNENVQLVSGASARLFEQVLKDVSAYDLMLEILNNEIYDCITV